MSDWVTIVRSLVRPYLALVFSFGTIYLAVKGDSGVEGRDILLITSTISAFYFGERAALKMPGEIKNGEVQGS